jgi:predicted glycoside hydrolase/deacetylase ChbG (UPF0249 family)
LPYFYAKVSTIISKVKILFHADDYGLSRGITDNILLCHDNGVLNRISLIANGYDYEYACQQLKQRKSLGVCVHLNLIEGSPLTKAPLLINQTSGLLNLTFVSMLKANEKLKSQIFEECSAQILRIRQTLSMQTISLDSHQHYHMVPWLFYALIKHRKSLGIESIRCAADPARLSDLFVTSPLSVAKNTFLRFIHLINQRKTLTHQYLQQNNNLFWGLLYTGKQNMQTINRCFQRIKNNADIHTLEILLHPGQAKAGEEHFWKYYPKLLKYYYSSDRLQEQQTLLKLQGDNNNFIQNTVSLKTSKK